MVNRFRGLGSRSALNCRPFSRTKWYFSSEEDKLLIDVFPYVRHCTRLGRSSQSISHFTAFSLNRDCCKRRRYKWPSKSKNPNFRKQNSCILICRNLRRSIFVSLHNKQINDLWPCSYDDLCNAYKYLLWPSFDLLQITKINVLNKPSPVCVSSYSLCITVLCISFVKL